MCHETASVRSGPWPTTSVLRDRDHLGEHGRGSPRKACRGTARTRAPRETSSDRAHQKVHASFRRASARCLVTQLYPRISCPSPPCPMPQPRLPHAPAADTRLYTNDPIHGNNEVPWGLLMGIFLLLSLSLWSIALLPAGIFLSMGRSIALLPTGITSRWSLSLRGSTLLPTSGVFSRWSLALRGLALLPLGTLS